MKSIKNIINSDNRIFGLDLLRCLAIFLVIFGHASYILPKPYCKIHDEFVLLDGVNLFFVLSGFLIGSILIKRINQETKFSFSSLLNFWMMRWLRTLPAYFFTLIIIIVIKSKYDVNFKIDQQVLMYFVFLQNFAIHNMPVFGESWSLSIEEWFYLLFPVLIIFATYISTDKKRVILICIFIFLLFPSIVKVIKFVEFKDNNDYSWDKEFRRLVITRLDSIAFGILGAYLSFYYQYNWIKYKRKALYLGALIMLLVIVMSKINVNNMLVTFYTTVIYFPLSATGILLFLPYLSNMRIGKGAFSKIVTYISIISYSLYLINYSLLRQFIIKDVLYNNIIAKIHISAAATYLIEYVSYWILLFALSHLMFIFVEHPFIKNRKKIIKFFRLNNE